MLATRAILVAEAIQITRATGTCKLEDCSSDVEPLAQFTKKRTQKTLLMNLNTVEKPLLKQTVHSTICTRIST